MNKKIIARNFSRCAYLYDRYADVQKKAALEILGGIEDYSFSKVLEIGCGTGNYTFLLREKFKKARITALDISGKMVEVAREKLKDKDIEFIVADGESVNFPDEDFDLVTSNACFQWFENLEAALQKYKSLLKKDGLILFSIFGPLTFRELNASLESLLQNMPIAANNFMNKDKIKKILSNNFKEFKIRELRYEESFASLLRLLNKIKYTGIRGNGLGSKISLGWRYLKKLEEAYLNKFQQIKVTYQIFFCQGLVE
ncbi:MAG: malonyl-[acyl-carrier protein] O-methyltransferase BioC [Candidatus Omnitrophica bacterium CG23_combo_of_CG06-09_8_20_14_all_40_11]|nr:MAG: malonyl-[acyl-carrier protein] O-methyltransferase BioC [Candidatus Omnitrophica bacterium CG23_combo_of_CG06-09_8_20_14_all_40_11]